MAAAAAEGPGVINISASSAAGAGASSSPASAAAAAGGGGGGGGSQLELSATIAFVSTFIAFIRSQHSRSADEEDVRNGECSTEDKRDVREERTCMHDGLLWLLCRLTLLL